MKKRLNRHKRRLTGPVRIYSPILPSTATCNLTGREAEARAAAETVLKINPNFSAERFRNDLYLLFKDKSQIDLTINALHQAGLK